MGSPWIRRHFLFSHILKGFLFAWTLWIYLQKLEVRSFKHSWDNRGYSKNLGSPWVRPRTLFSQICNGLLFAWMLWIYLPNLKFVALRVPEIIGGTVKNWELHGYANALFSPLFLRGFCSHGPSEYTCQNLNFVALRVPEIIGGTVKICKVPDYAHAPLSPKFLTGFCSHGRLSTSGKKSRRRSIWKTETF